MASDGDHPFGLQHLAQQRNGDGEQVSLDSLQRRDGDASGNGHSSPSSNTHNTLSSSIINSSSLARLLENSFSSDLQRQLAWERKKQLHSVDEEKEEVVREMAGEGVGRREGYEEEEVEVEADGGDETDDGSESSECSDESSVGSEEEGKCRVREEEDEDLDEERKQEGGYRRRGSVGRRIPRYNKSVFLVDERRAENEGVRSRASIRWRSRGTTKYLRDEDLEELRGSIELGFGFSPLHDSFRISSPGDSSIDVKHRLRQWAKAVACSIKEGF